MVSGSFIEANHFENFKNYAEFEELGFANWGFSNYGKVFNSKFENPITGELMESKGNNFGVFFLNTFIVAVGSTTVTVVTAVLAAFAFARLQFKGKEALFALLLATMMIPGEMMVITNYMTVRMMGWMNTFAALILVHGVSVFYVFYLRQTFQQIPNELYLAAKVDGVSDLGYLWKVMIPIAMPTIVTIIILSLMGAWNSYVWPLLVANGGWKYNKDYSMQLVSNGLMSLFTSDIADGQDAIKIAGSMVVTFPLFVFFLIFRKYIMRGVSRSGIKG
jgi:multiple sugar transport system permease protein